MISSPDILRELNGTRGTTRPVWLMRQAGRYLPEYRALRAQKGGFLNLVYDSDAAAEITIQPIRRFGFDAAILFSDILIIPYAMGQDLAFMAGEGPKLTPPLTASKLSALNAVPERLTPIYDTVAKVRAMLDSDFPDTALFGFAGSPWTVSTYMVHGEGSRDQASTRQMAYSDPAGFDELICAITAMTIEYLAGQIDAGAQAVQLFDSWSGSLSPAQFERWVIAPNAKIVSELQRRYAHVPIIGFPKGAGEKLPAYARETGVKAIGIDETIDPFWAAQNLPDDVAVQGNLDPLVLLSGGEDLRTAVQTITEAFSDRAHVFNLGHGIIKETPIAHVEQLLSLVRGGV